jgi:hypothetical protein
MQSPSSLLWPRSLSPPFLAFVLGCCLCAMPLPLLSSSCYSPCPCPCPCLVRHPYAVAHIFALSPCLRVPPFITPVFALVAVTLDVSNRPHRPYWQSGTSFPPLPFIHLFSLLFSFSLPFHLGRRGRRSRLCAVIDAVMRVRSESDSRPMP